MAKYSLSRIRQFLEAHEGTAIHVGVEEPPGLRPWSSSGIERLRVLPLEPGIKSTLDSLLRDLAWFEAELKEVEATLGAIMEKRHEGPMKRLRAIPGIGPIVAATFLLEVFRPERFRCQEEVVACLGLAPMVRQSGERSGKARIVPVGQKRLRSLLIEAARIWQRKVPKVKERHNRLLGRSGIAQKAITAIARHLAILLWRLSLPPRSC